MDRLNVTKGVAMTVNASQGRKKEKPERNEKREKKSIQKKTAPDQPLLHEKKKR